MLQPADLHVLAPLVCCVAMLMTVMTLSCIVYRQMQISGDAWVITLRGDACQGRSGKVTCAAVYLSLVNSSAVALSV
jgi:hypothetical protein